MFKIDDGDNNVSQIVNISDLTITEGSTSGNGGGIYNFENLTLIGSTVSSNTTKNRGGGIFNQASTANITNSTISENSTSSDGGGIANNNSTVSITNSTISGNSTFDDGGGIFNNNSTVSITNSTISGNSAGDGGGIFNQASTVISSTIVSGNNAGTGDEIFNRIGSFTVNADANNLFGDSSKNNGEAFFNFTPGQNDINATSNGTNTALADILDPAGLQDNGGETETIALVPNSPAIDAGTNDEGLLTDQRGVTREINGIADIGAFEFDNIAPTLTAPADVTLEAGESIDIANTGNATATDNLDPDVEITFSDDDQTDDNGLGDIIRTFTATDDSGNSSSETQTITIIRNSIEGTTANNSIVAMDTADEIDAGDGNDVVRARGSGDIVNGDDGNDRLYGDGGNDIINGGDDNDFIDGGTEHDFLNGEEGNDRIYGGTGNDTLLGGIGNEFILGEQGDDLIDGGQGFDRLRGGEGNDTFVLRSGDGRDIIYDFTNGIDSFGLIGSLTFEDLSIGQFGSRSDVTQILDTTDNNATLALLVGVSFTDIDSTDFTALS